jgi:urease accessory protein
MKKTAAALFLLLAATSALAHSQPGGGLLHGFLHPFTGIDHLAAMLIVGVWAARHTGAARLALPFTFLSSMLIGALIGKPGWVLPAVEALVVASAMVFAIALLARIRLTLSVALVAGFGLFHGFAHIAELPTEADFRLFTAGMLAGTALLHAIGLAIAITAARPRLA